MENLLSLQLKKTNKNHQKLFKMKIALVPNEFTNNRFWVLHCDKIFSLLPPPTNFEQD